MGSRSYIGGFLLYAIDYFCINSPYHFHLLQSIAEPCPSPVVNNHEPKFVTKAELQEQIQKITHKIIEDFDKLKSILLMIEGIQNNLVFCIVLFYNLLVIRLLRATIIGAEMMRYNFLILTKNLYLQVLQICAVMMKIMDYPQLYRLCLMIMINMMVRIEYQ